MANYNGHPPSQHRYPPEASAAAAAAAAALPPPSSHAHAHASSVTQQQQPSSPPSHRGHHHHHQSQYPPSHLQQQPQDTRRAYPPQGASSSPAVSAPHIASSAPSHYPPPPRPTSPRTSESPKQHHASNGLSTASSSGLSREPRKPSTFFDPTAEHRTSAAAPSSSKPAWSEPASSAPRSRSPSASYGYPPTPRNQDRRPYDAEHNVSPPSTHRSYGYPATHQSPPRTSTVSEYPDPRTASSARLDEHPQATRQMVAPPLASSATVSAPTQERAPAATPPRRADPMSFSSILASSDPAPSAQRTSPSPSRKPTIASTLNHEHTSPHTSRDELFDRSDQNNSSLDHQRNHHAPPPPSLARHTSPAPPNYSPRTHHLSKPVSDNPLSIKSLSNGDATVAKASPYESFDKKQPSSLNLTPKSSSRSKSKPNGAIVDEPLKSTSSSRTNQMKTLVPTEKEIQAALARIEAAEHSDVEGPEFDEQRRLYQERSAKRAREITEQELVRRKRRRIAQATKYGETFGRQSVAAKERYLQRNEAVAWKEIQAQEQADEKERKKIMQRNRRRENTKQKAEQQAAELKQKARETKDRAERERFIKEAQRAEKKASQTSRLLNGEDLSKEIREVTPMAPNMEGGVMSSFQMSDDAPSSQPKKRARGHGGARPKKSKEQKQAEIDRAAHAAQGDDDLTPLAPKPETPAVATPLSKSAKKKEEKAEKAVAPKAVSPPVDEEKLAQEAAEKAYNSLYEQIWRDIARKDMPKLNKFKDAALATKQSNMRKTAQLASKEARRWQLKTNKSTKDTQARAKRVMREMLSFWKRNEREERDQRKIAEKQELENARKAEADREANRQKRKLNFLISQTELYSHFIGKKVKTDEVERSTDDVAVSDQKIKEDPNATHTVDLPDSVADTSTKVTNFEDLDFDAEDESVLQEAAMANAQNAVKEAQDRARAFNDGQLQSQFDDGEMNFQNPTSLGSVDIPQPKMLTCQLKEYQLKGLNWLVNLYEQGINGILADEMGLGKTVQSISVMAYLAEYHNIWGPFLVIAPASTLHNWQQEITRFVPDLTVLPYWGNAKDRKILRKFWDRRHITYNKDSPFHVLVTSYQLVVQDTQYFQKIRWQYMILDEAQAIKSSQSSRWKSLLGFHCRNRLLLTGTPIQNNMQELWALLHFIMPSLFDSHDEFSDWFSKDIESHAQSNTKLNEDQLKRLHMILKPFMLRRIKKHVQKELGDKIEEDVFCDLTYRQRAYYSNLRNKISIMDLIEKAAVGDDQDTATLMNLVMQFRKVCNHPDLFERAETMSPISFSYFAETASFLREGHSVDVGYSVRNLIEFPIPRLIGRGSGRLDLAGPDNDKAGWRRQFLYHRLNIWTPEHITKHSKGAFSWARFADTSVGAVCATAHKDIFTRLTDLQNKRNRNFSPDIFRGDGKVNDVAPQHALFNIVENGKIAKQASMIGDGIMGELLNVSRSAFYNRSLNSIEPCSRPAASAPPIEPRCSSQGAILEKKQTFFNVPIRRALFEISDKTEELMLSSKLDPTLYPVSNMLPRPISEKARYTKIQVPSMRRFVSDSGKLARLDRLLAELKEGGHRVLLYFQMTRMIDLMEEYLTYRNYKYCRLDGSTKLEDRRDTVADFQNKPEIFVFLLSTRAGGLGINLTAADTVIFYDSDWNPTIDSQAMDRAHRLGQTRQVTVYRMITRGTIEERIRKRALQKEEVQRVVISGGAGVDFNTRSRENRTKDIAMWLADDDQAAQIEKKEAEILEREAKEPQSKKKKQATSGSRKKMDMTLDDMYHEGEGNFDDSSKPSGAATPVDMPAPSKRKGTSKKAKSIREKLAIADGGV